MITFTGSAEASMRNALDKLHKAATADNEWIQDGAFQDAMHSVINLAVAIHGGDHPPEAELALFRDRVSQLLSHRENRGNLGSYIAAADTAAGRALQPGAYYEAALARTAIQLLLDDYPGVAEWLSQPSRDELADTDEALRDAAEEVPPLHAEGVPAGMPDTHWWWTAPAGDPDTYDLLHGQTEDDPFS